MRTRPRFICGMVLLAVLLAGSLAPAMVEDPDTKVKVTVRVVNKPASEALRLMFEKTDHSYVLQGGGAGTGRVTLDLKNMELGEAIRALCASSGLTWLYLGNKNWRFTPQKDVVTIGGKQVPVLGAMRAEDVIRSITVTGPDGQVTPIELDVEPTQRLPGGGGGGLRAGTPSVVESRPVLPGIQNEMITFEVSDRPLREAMAKLTAETGHDVYVPAAVPDAVRITARVYLVPIQDFLQSVAQQARLWLRYTLVDAAGKSAPWVTIEPGGAKRILLQPSPENKLHYRFCLAPDSLLGITDGARVLRPFAGYAHSSKDLPDYFGPDPVDLDVKDLPLRAAMAKLAASSGYDIVVSEAVPATLKVSVRAYYQPARWFLDRIAEGAGLEIREQLLGAKGEPLPSEMAGVSPRTIDEMKRQGRIRTRYTLVPKSEIKVSGAGIPEGAPTREPVTLELQSLPSPIPPGSGFLPLLGADPIGTPVASPPAEAR